MIIPTHNRINLLRRAVASVIEQTYTDFEIIIVDDCSTDGTNSERLGIDDSRIVFLRNEKCMGANYSRNVGIRASRGEFICALDDDDEWLPTKLEKQVEIMQRGSSTLGLVYSGYYSVTEGGTILCETIPTLKGQVNKEIMEVCSFGAPTVMVKKEYLLEAGLYDEKLKSCQDWDLWIRILRLCEADYVPESLAKYCIHGNQVSTDLRKLIEGRLYIYQKYEEELSKSPSINGKHLQHLGVLHLLDCNRSEGMHFLIKSIITNPFQAWPYLHIIMNIFFPRMHSRFLKRQNTATYGKITLYS